ncbi:hypothetical protein SISSUDRAFT_924818 [Sistotremastrum suecicum HHB10207 ss-3]|uniref:Uncharacterized protein n=1 Tax=Sistotremastrum suecicum HHB10207 ss-3 TaxID=1314776 RepID=A0A166BVG4_9AGAM|nr:hypothetical protein SISSUDRAFT_924818 [Sistotremastrum suecicum HHB10207 ss-3]
MITRSRKSRIHENQRWQGFSCFVGRLQHEGADWPCCGAISQDAWAKFRQRWGEISTAVGQNQSNSRSKQTSDGAIKSTFWGIFLFEGAQLTDYGAQPPQIGAKTIFANSTRLVLLRGSKRHR